MLLLLLFQYPVYQFQLYFEDFEDAYKVVLMDEHIHNFPALAPEELLIKWDIADPIGKSVEQFRKARGRIILKVKGMVNSLK